MDATLLAVVLTFKDTTHWQTFII